MSRSRYLLSNINLINILLTGVLIFLVNYMLLPFLNKSIQYSLPVIKKHEEIDSGSDKNPDQIKTPSPFDYAILSEQNLFHPERKIPVEVKEAQSLPKPDFVLYGTLLSGDMNIAYMEDKKSPHSTPGRGKRQSALKLGNSMSGFTLKEVATDKVVMVRGEDTIIVLLDDPQKPKTRDAQTHETAVAQEQPVLAPGQQASTPQQKPFLPQTQPSATPIIPASSKQTSPKGGPTGGGGLMRFFDR